MFESSVLFKDNYSATDKVVVNQGGSSSGKTYSILQVLFLRAIEHPRSVTTIVGETIPNLKSGALRDAQTIVANSPILTKLIASYNATDRVYTLYNGSVLEFKSYETSQSAKSGKRQFLFVNEANGISYEIWNELYLRTTIQAFIDYNPNAEFWVHEKIIGKDGVRLFISDHRHNPYVLPAIREKIEGLKDIDLELWKVYARGRTGRIEGLVFRNWDICDSIDKVRCKLVALGMDWGFTNDPTALCAVWRDGEHLYIEELLYERGLTNQDIGARLKDMAIGRTMEIIADSAEPKSIEEVHRMGFNIHGANKGKDSIQNSIDILKRYKLHVLRGSVNLIKELNSYKWKQDKNGNPLNEPVDFQNHCFVGSTLISSASGQKRIDEIKDGEYVYTSKGLKPVVKVWRNGKKQVSTYLIECDTFLVSLTCTDNHKVKTNQGWLRIDQLEQGMQVYLRKPLMAQSIINTQTKGILQKAQKSCIELCGNFTKGLFQKDTTYITLMEIPKIMILKTLTLFKALCICAILAKKDLKTILNGLRNFGQKELRAQRNGTSHKKAENGTLNTAKAAGLTDLTQSTIVKYAERNIKLASQAEQSFAIKTVRRKPLEQEERVYDLMIDECHEYYANGLLVHNCIDALRYVALNKLKVANSGKYFILQA